MYKNLQALPRALVRTCTRFALLAGALTVTGSLQGAPPKGEAPALATQEPIKAAFVYVAPITDAGWVHQHELGRQAVVQALGSAVQTVFVENVAEGADAERVIRDLAAQGQHIIFTPSFGYMEPTLRVAKDYPQTRFESITGYKTAPNVATANARYYEGRYLAGVAAGRMTQTGQLGYVAGFPIPEVLQGINAFTLGARSVNPQAVVKVIWLNAWFDPPREREAAMTLFNQNVDVLAFHTGSTAPMVAAQERGRMAVAYHSDMRHIAPDAQIVAVKHSWGRYYTERVQALRAGRWASGQVWGGLASGMVQVGDYGRRVPQDVQRQVREREREIVRAKRHVFSGPLHDNTGRLVLPAGERMSDAQILNMNFLVSGVQGSLPQSTP